MLPQTWRELKGLTIAEAAKELGTDKYSVSRYERGDPVDTRRLAERFSARTGGLVSIEEWMFPAGVPALVTLTAADAEARSQG
jgi:transcriptional regulator with XRE-family HTH domain